MGRVRNRDCDTSRASAPARAVKNTKTRLVVPLSVEFCCVQTFKLEEQQEGERLAKDAPQGNRARHDPWPWDANHGCKKKLKLHDCAGYHNSSGINSLLAPKMRAIIMIFNRRMSKPQVREYCPKLDPAPGLVSIPFRCKSVADCSLVFAPSTKQYRRRVTAIKIPGCAIIDRCLVQCCSLTNARDMDRTVSRRSATNLLFSVIQERCSLAILTDNSTLLSDTPVFTKQSRGRNCRREDEKKCSYHERENPLHGNSFVCDLTQCQCCNCDVSKRSKTIGMEGLTEGEDSQLDPHRVIFEDQKEPAT